MVFAQELEISGHFRVGADAIAGDNTEKPDGVDESILGAGVTGFQGRVNFRAANDDGTFGGYLRFQADAGNKLGPMAGITVGQPDTIFLRNGWAWWQPIDLLKLQAGYRFNDFFAVYDIVDTFGGNAEETNVYNSGTNGFDGLVNGAFAQQFDQSGVALSLYPMEGLAINLGLPLANGYVGDFAHYTVENAYLGTGDATGLLAQVAYEMADTFRVAIAFRANKSTLDMPIGGTIDEITATNSALYLGFYLTAIENMGLNIGARITFPTSEEVTIVKYTYNHPVLIGVGFNFDMDAFGIGARLGVSLGESAKTDVSGAEEWKGDTKFGIQILPSFDLGVCKVFLNAGVTIIAPGDNNETVFGKKPDTVVGFHINPYVEKTIGGGSFFAGFDIYSDGDKVNATATSEGDTRINWRIPCGMKFAF